MNFKAKTYLNGTQIHTVVNEPVLVPSTDESIYLEHDFVSEILIYTGLDKTGTQITDFVANKDATRSWMTYINFGSTARSTYQNTTVYINYKSEGDMVDSLMINRLEIEMERHQTEDPHNASSGLATQVASTSPIDGATNGGSTVIATMNKWIDNGQESKLKVYSDSARTIEVSGTVAKSGNKTLTWNPTSSLSASTSYYPSVLSGLLGIDGVASTSTYNWSFQTAANQSPSLSVAVTGTTNLGDTLTASTTIGSDPEGDTVQSTTWRWLRSGSAISGATSNTYVLAEADLGKSITAEATVTMNTGSSPAPKQSNAISIPVPNPPSISVASSDSKNTISFTQNSTLNTETYNLYWSTSQTTASNIKSSGTKITGITSPYEHTPITNGTQYNYVLVMVVNGVESSPSGVASGTPATNASPTVSVSVSGTTTIGSTLTASTTVGSDPEGDTVSSTAWAWLRDDVAITGATSATYVIAEADVGKTLKAKATVTMSAGGNPSPATSSGTLIPIPAPPAILVSAGNTQNTISFTQNSTLATETYNLYWSTTSGVNKTNGTKITGMTSPYNHTGRINGTTYYYVLTMVINGVESVESAQVSGTPQTQTLSKPIIEATVTSAGNVSVRMTTASTLV